MDSWDLNCAVWERHVELVNIEDSPTQINYGYKVVFYPMAKAKRYIQVTHSKYIKKEKYSNLITIHKLHYWKKQGEAKYFCILDTYFLDQITKIKQTFCQAPLPNSPFLSRRYTIKNGETFLLLFSPHFYLSRFVRSMPTRVAK